MIESSISPEKNRSIILTCITLGKELHAGHMLLLATADLLRVGLGSLEPITLINNNTGPRAAGALISLAEQEQLPIEDTAHLLTQGLIAPDTIVNAYRGRIETGDMLTKAMSLLDEGNYDIFKIMADIMEAKLKEAGFRVNIVPESSNLMINQEIIEMVNPAWSGSGFMFSGEKGIRILRRGGQLTASGKCLVSLTALAKSVINSGQIPLTVFVDSAPDTNDAVMAFSSLGDLGRAMQLQGAGISFGGAIASGSKGEALTLSEVIEDFKKQLPLDSLKLALRHMVLTRPAIVAFAESPTLGALFDFNDNDSFINDLVRCNAEALDFRTQMSTLVNDLRVLIGEESKATDPKIEKWLSYLPLRTMSILEIKPERIVDTMRNIEKVLKNPNEISTAVSNQGYRGKEAQAKINQYKSGPEGLVMRNNYYSGILKSIINIKDKLTSLTREDFNLLETTINFCLERLGYVE